MCNFRIGQGMDVHRTETGRRLVLGGVDDKIVTANASVELAQKLGCELHMYDGLGHSAYEEAPDFDKRVKCFFDFR